MRVGVNKFRCPLTAALIVAWSGAALAGKSGSLPSSDLKSSSGGTAMSKSGGNGGTGLPNNANASLGTFKPTFKPSHVTEPPMAGVRPHTDLAASEKLTNLGSRRLIKRSALFNKIANAPHDPNLVRAALPKIGGTKESSRTFHSVPGFTAEESKGTIHPMTRVDSGGRPMASLSSGGGTPLSMVRGDAADADEMAPEERGWLLNWLFQMAAFGGTTALGWWLWLSAPKGATMRLPARIEG